MPRIEITQTISAVPVDGATAAEPTFVTPDIVDFNYFENAEQDVLLFIKNGSGSPVTATFNTPNDVKGNEIEERDVVVAAGTDVIVGPFPNSAYGNAGQVFVDFSAATSIEVAALKVGDL